MNLPLRQNAAWDLVVPTSMGIRMTPLNGQPVHAATTFQMSATSAETNVASVPSYLGLSVKVLTKFVEGSPISRFIKDNLASRHMQYEGLEVDQGGPWGFRHQINFADSGWGSRGPRVLNDRAGEVGRSLKSDDFDLERLFADEGVKVIHLSGLIAALSPETGRFCLDLARMAKQHQTRVSFDLNHRASFWINREEELRSLFIEIARETDVLVGNEEDFQLCLGVEGPEAGGKDLSAKSAGYKIMIAEARRAFPNTSVFGTTLREVISANSHRWGAILSTPDEFLDIQPREIGVIDRIGGGDGFVGGLLYGMLREWDTEKCLQFGWATGALVTTLETDYAQPADEDQIWSVWSGNARVKR